MSVLKAGFAKSNINPDLGIPICGYYIPRFAKGFLDDLEARALALSLGDTKVLLISLDQCYTKPSWQAVSGKPWPMPQAFLRRIYSCPAPTATRPPVSIPVKRWNSAARWRPMWTFCVTGWQTLRCWRWRI